MSPAHGLWIDDPPSVVLTNKYLDRFREHGFSTAAVMLESVSSGFDPNWTPGQLAEIGQRFRDYDIELVLTVWPEPRAAYIAQLVEKIPPLLKTSGAAALEFDAESNYTRKKVVGFRNLEEASAALVTVIKKFGELDVRSELTTFTMHEENSARATLADDVDRVLAQGYSVRSRKGADGENADIPWDHAYGPGKMQRLTFERTKKIPKKPNGKPLMACGLAAYDQIWPGHSPDEAMRIAYEEALRFDPIEVRWWSSKWVIGVRSNQYASRFFKLLAQ